MKRNIFILFLLFSLSSVLHAQSFDEIRIIARQHAEPPTKEVRPWHELTYKLEDSVLFHTSSNQKHILKSKEHFVIPKELIDSLNRQISKPESMFILNRKINGEDYKSVMLDIDSLNFCKKYAKTKMVSTGGFQFEIEILAGGKQLFYFKHDSSNPLDFDFIGYLTVYAILENKLPVELPGSELFKENFLSTKLNEYFETIHCEDYFYQKFIEQHPERTPQQNRTKEGWNFEEYLKQRNVH